MRYWFPNEVINIADEQSKNNDISRNGSLEMIGKGKPLALLKEMINNKKRSRRRLKRLHAEPPPVSEPRISQGHVIKGSYDIKGRSPSREAIILPSLVAIDSFVIEI